MNPLTQGSRQSEKILIQKNGQKNAKPLVVFLQFYEKSEHLDVSNYEMQYF